MMQFDDENGDRVGNSAVAWGEGGNRNYPNPIFSSGCHWKTDLGKESMYMVSQRVSKHACLR